MSVYDTIRDGIADDFRKARDYDRVIAQHKKELSRALENPNEDVWRSGFDSGFEVARRLYRGERPLHESAIWEEFKKSRENKSSGA